MTEHVPTVRRTRGKGLRGRAARARKHELNKPREHPDDRGVLTYE